MKKDKLISGKGISASDARYKVVTTSIGRKKLRIWSTKTGAEFDAKSLRRRGFKVSMAPDRKTVIVHGQTMRSRKKHTSQTLRRKRRGGSVGKPYGPGFDTFRQHRMLQRYGGWMGN